MKLLNNYLSLAGAEVFSKLVTFAAFAYLARALGPGEFGYIEFAGAVLMCASLIVDQGFSPFGAREIAKAPEQTGRLTGEVVTARFALAIISYLAVVLLALLTDKGSVMVRLLLVYGLSLWAAPLLLQWVFQGHERMHVVAIAQVVRQTVFAGMVFIFVRGSDQILMVAWAEVAGVTCSAIFCVLMYQRLFKGQTRLRPAVSARIFRDGVPIGLSQMFWVVKMFGGTLILGFIATASDTGFFAGAQRILVALHAFVWLYFFNLLPSMSRYWQRDRAEFGLLIARSMQVIVWLGLAFGLGWVIMARDVMQVVYGKDFAAAGPVLAMFAAVWVMAVISGHFRFGLIAAGRQNKEMLTSGLGALVAVITISAGYYRWGLIGAAAGLVSAEAVVFVSSWYYARRNLNLNGIAGMFVRPVIAVTASSLAWLVPTTSAILRTTVALSILLIVALVLDSKVRERLREVFALRHAWSERRLSKAIAKAPDSVNA